MGKAPAVIGRYQVLNRIGQGGMGSLFLAWDPLLERQIAIKILRDDNEELRERFAREARSAARLRHPNIVTIFDVGEQDGQPFIAMEYIQGETLADVIRAGRPLGVRRKLRLIDELCDGLAFAHRVGIVHRDVKPANVMVEREGSVKVLDFGIARIAESGMTQAGMLLGTLNYMSPEQVAGQVADARSDLFAVGAVLYEVLSYRQAFPGGLHSGILNRILNEPPAPLDRLCAGLDPEIVRIVNRTLEKRPEDRYPDLPSLRKDLQRVQARLVEDEQAAGGPAAAEDDAHETVPIEAPNPPVRRARPHRAGGAEELARRRAAQIAAHMDEARRAMTAGDLEAALASAEHALLLDPDHAPALEIVDSARGALDDRQLEELVRRGHRFLEQGSLTDAVALAQQALTIVPGSTLALELLDRIRRARVEREHARRRADAAGAAVARGRALFERGAFEEAAAAADEALALVPELAAARSLQAEARAAHQRALQDALDRRAAETVERARSEFAEGRHDAAIERLERFEVGHDAVAAALELLRQARAQIEAERRRAEERAREAAAAIARAERTPAHEAAIEILQRALARDDTHEALRARLADRVRALEQEREQARLARERRERIDNALRRASAAPHVEALHLLDLALQVDPGDVELRQLREARQQALDREEAERREARRRDAVAAADRTVRGHIANADFEAAEAALHEAERDLHAARELKAARRRLARARAGAAARAVRASVKEAARPARGASFAQPRLLARAAGVAILVAGGAYLASRPSGVRPDGDGGSAPAATSPAAPAEPSTSERPGLPAPAATTGEPASTGTSSSTTPDAGARASEDEAAGAALQRARQYLALGQLPEALDAAARALRQTPGDEQLRSMVTGIVARARQDAASARSAAVGRSEAALLPAYRDAQLRMAEGDRHRRGGRHEQAAAAFWQAADLFAGAERDAAARAAAAAASPAPAPPPAGPSPSSPPPASPPAASTGPGRGEATPSPGRVEGTAEGAAARPAGPPPASAPPPSGGDARGARPPESSSAAAPAGPSSAGAAPVAADEAAIRATLAAYEAAYTALQVDAVRRVYPSIDAAALARSFRDLAAQEVEISIETMAISGNTATVTARVRQTFTPRAGSGRTEVVRSTFRLQRAEGGRWVIAERR